MYVLFFMHKFQYKWQIIIVNIYIREEGIMEYTERMKEKYMTKVDKINKIDDEGTRVHLKLKLMADIINELSKN